MVGGNYRRICQTRVMEKSPLVIVHGIDPGERPREPRLDGLQIASLRGVRDRARQRHICRKNLRLLLRRIGVFHRCDGSVLAAREQVTPAKLNSGQKLTASWTALW